MNGNLGMITIFLWHGYYLSMACMAWLLSFYGMVAIFLCQLWQTFFFLAIPF